MPRTSDPTLRSHWAKIAWPWGEEEAASRTVRLCRIRLQFRKRHAERAGVHPLLRQKRACCPYRRAAGPATGLKKSMLPIVAAVYGQLASPVPAMRIAALPGQDWGSQLH